MSDVDTTSDYSGSVSLTSSDEESDEETNKACNHKVSDSSALLWTGNGSKKCPLIIFRPECLITKEKKLKAIGEKYHLTYKMVKTESKLVRSLLSSYGFHEVHPNSADFNLMWTGAHLKPFSLRSLQDFQKVNHFPRSYEITRKDRLYKNIERMSHTKGTKHFDFIPRSYLMPSEYQEFCAAFVKEKGSWIVKPIASSRGRGIYLINNPNQVPLEDNIMVCKYVSNPLLIDGFKFDIRVYVAVTSYDPLLIYMFEEGLTRFATVKYEKTNRHLKNQMMHLTNYSINKKSHDYVRCEDPDVEDYGNKWSMSAMLRYLKQEGIDTAQLMMKIEAVIIKSILAAELPIATACKMFVPHKENCIELYGFDILVDENLKPWILEGNLSPSLACDAPLDLKIKSSMVADFFSLAGFSCVDPMTRKQTKKQLDVMRTPTKRPSSAVGFSKDSSSGISPDEARVLKISREQYQRRGGFVRIFPTPETWEQYGSFLEYKSSLNHMLAQKLFPDLSFSTKTMMGAYSTAVARMKNVAANQILEGRHHLVAERSMQYERKLLSLESCKRRRSQTSRRKQKQKETPIGVDTKSSAHDKLIRSTFENGEDSENEVTSVVPPSKSRLSASSSQTSDRTRTSSSNSNSSIKHQKLPSPKTLAKEKDLSKSSKDTVKQISDNKGGKSTNNFSGKQQSGRRVYMYKTDQKEKDEIEKVQQNINQKLSHVVGESTSPKTSDDEGCTNTGNNHHTKIESLIKLNLGKPKKKVLNVLETLKSGGNLGKIQARQAFSSYLSKVQHRLMVESESRLKESAEVVLKQEEQMDLVMRFLKRAAGNLRQPFSVVVPSRRLSLHDRKRILAKQLGDFVHVYNKETEGMEQKSQLGLQKDLSGDLFKHGERCVEDDVFRSFVVNASEISLEEVLTAYTQKNKSASVFLGASKPKSARIRSNQEVLTSEPISVGAGSNSHVQNKLFQKGSSDGLSSVSSTGSYTFDEGSEVATNSSAMLSPSSIHHEPMSSSYTSMQHAALVYSAKLSPYKTIQSHRRPASAKPFSSISGRGSNSGRPVSASSRTMGSSLHYQTSPNHEALADALQRLTEKQAARQYSAPVQLTTLTHHLSNVNLSNLDYHRGHHHQGMHRQANSPTKSTSLCDLASFDPSVQSMVDPAKHGKFSSNLKKVSQPDSNPDPQKQNFVESSLQFQQSKAKHQSMIVQHGKQAASFEIADDMAHIQALYNSLFQAGELPTKQCKMMHSQRVPTNKPEKEASKKNNSLVNSHLSSNGSLGSVKSFSPVKDKTKSTVTSSQLHSKPPTVPRPPDQGKTNGRHPTFRKTNPHVLSTKNGQEESESSTFYSSIKYDSQTGATKHLEKKTAKPPETLQTNDGFKRSWKP